MPADPSKRPPLDVLIATDDEVDLDGVESSLLADGMQPRQVVLGALDADGARSADVLVLPATPPAFERLATLTGEDLPPVLMCGHDLAALEEGLRRGAEDFLRLPAPATLACWRVRACAARRTAPSRQPRGGTGGGEGLPGALAALDERDQLVRRIVHDLNNPLTNVLGTADLLLMQARQDEDTSPRQLRRLTSLRSSAEDLATLIQAVHELNLLSRGERRAHLGEEDARVLVKEGLDTFARTYGDTSDLILVPALESIRVRADRSLLPSVVLHLVNHSVKRLGGAGRIELDLVELDDARVAVTLRLIGAELKPVEETALGQAAVAGDATALSLGIRLAYCKLAMQAQGGALRAASTPGGASFILELHRA